MSLDLAARQAILDASYGPASGDLTVEAWTGLPDAGGVEVSGGGYAPGVVLAADWEPADDEGVRWSSELVDWGEPTEAWSDSVTHFRLVDGDGVSWGAFPLGTVLDVGGAGDVVQARIGVFIGTLDLD